MVFGIWSVQPFPFMQSNFCALNGKNGHMIENSSGSAVSSAASIPFGWVVPGYLTCILMFISRVGPLSFGLALYLPSGPLRRAKEDQAI